MSLTQLQSKNDQIIRYESDIAKNVEKKADFSKKIADKRVQRIRYQQQLDREIKTDQNRQDQVEKRRKQEELKHHQQITSELQKQKQITTELNERPSNFVQKKYDFFISHATEDKSFVRTLAEKLKSLGLKIWYDEFELKIGDSLRQKIDEGLISSKYGIVVLSNSFLSKNGWNKYELNGLVSKEMNGVKVTLPIWHKVTKDQVLSYSPSLADKFALNTSSTKINEIADEVRQWHERNAGKRGL